jgi:formate hydrogenlyase transcriptional activator
MTIQGSSSGLSESSDTKSETQEILRMQELISDISTILIDLPPEKIDDQIIHALRRIVEFLGIDRSGFAEYSSDNPNLKMTHTYAVPGVEPQGPIFFTKAFPWLAQKLFRREIFLIASPEELPEEAAEEREYCRQSGLKSTVLIPFSVGGSMVCAIGFTCFQNHRMWPPRLVIQLKRVGEILAHTIYRKRAEEKSLNQLAKLENAYKEIEHLKNRLEAEANYLRSEIKLNYQYEDIIGESKAISDVLRQVEQVAATDSSVLLEGETGTGKELIARAIHNLSRRKDRPMVKVNCSALPSALIEAELFGREKGAYTGALTRQVGRFEVADDSTIFLDEISELSLDLQTKLLRVLQEGEFERLGSPRTLKVNVRVIAATNRNLSEAASKGTFREDLYYRLNVFPIKVPPLRERPKDIPLLVEAFLNEFTERMGKAIDGVSKRTMESLIRYPWPGNIRELRNVIERAVIITTGNVLHVSLPEAAPEKSHDLSSLNEVERSHIMQVLQKTNWIIKGPHGAAKILGMKPSTLYHRMKKLGIRTSNTRKSLILE